MVRRWTQADLEQVVFLGRQGKSWKDVGILMGRDAPLVWSAWQRAAGEDDRRARDIALDERGVRRGRYDRNGGGSAMAAAARG